MRCHSPSRKILAANARSRFTDQRHRLVFNGIWQVGYGFQLSGVYFYGSGQRNQVVCGCDARGLQIASVDRLRLDGTIIPRESFVGQPIHRVEMRLQERVRLHGRATLDGFVEVFNVFNRANYGLYDLTESKQDIRTADRQSESVLRAANPAAWVQNDVLNELKGPRGMKKASRCSSSASCPCGPLARSRRPPAGREPSWAFPAINGSLAAEEGPKSVPEAPSRIRRRKSTTSRIHLTGCRTSIRRRLRSCRRGTAPRSRAARATSCRERGIRSRPV